MGNKFFKSLLFTFTIAISLFGFSIENASAYPVFAQQGYSNPRAANGKLACANCHLNHKQISAAGKPADLNVGGILIFPKGFKLASKNQISPEVKAKNKGVFISPYSTEFDNILIVGPIAGKKHQELIFPVVAPDPNK